MATSRAPRQLETREVSHVPVPGLLPDARDDIAAAIN